jgi:epoxyqueuosine reductase QueG
MNISDIQKGLASFLEKSEMNLIPRRGKTKIYDSPIIGIAEANDPLFDELKAESVVGDFHLSPQEWFGEARSVISFFLPFSQEVRISNRRDSDPSFEWLYGRIEGETLNGLARKFLADMITDAGASVFIPVRDQRFAVRNMRSNWSERHVAFISGLGTFSLSKSLITEKGCAGE